MRRAAHTASVLLAPVIVLVTTVANLVHPFIHGTPLDGGALDAALANLNMFSAYLSVHAGSE